MSDTIETSWDYIYECNIFNGDDYNIFTINFYKNNNEWDQKGVSKVQIGATRNAQTMTIQLI